MKCEKCGRSLKSFFENGDHIYYYYLYHCRFCDLFYKHVEKFVEDDLIIEDEKEIEECRDELSDANVKILPTKKCLVHYQVIKDGQQIEAGTLNAEIESDEDLRNQMLHYFETKRGFNRKEVSVKLKSEIDAQN
jgi:hypothetical protein